MSVPNYSTVCRYRKTLTKEKIFEKVTLSSGELAIDSTGIKKHFQNDWGTEFYKIKKRKDWLKLHALLDVNTKKAINIEVTDNKVGDPSVVSDLMGDCDADTVMADGAYDTRECLKTIFDKGAIPIIPPRSNAASWKDKNGAVPKWAESREKSLKYLNMGKTRKEGRERFKKETKYHKRSLVENFFYRIKRIFGEGVQEKLFTSQKITLYVRRNLLNRFVDIGMPKNETIKT